jgi:hypothetical protein
MVCSRLSNWSGLDYDRWWHATCHHHPPHRCRKLPREASRWSRGTLQGTVSSLSRSFTIVELYCTVAELCHPLLICYNPFLQPPHLPLL